MKRLLATFLLLSCLAFAGRHFTGNLDIIGINGSTATLNQPFEALTMSYWFKLDSVPTSEVQPFGKGSQLSGNQLWYTFISGSGHIGQIGAHYWQNVPLNHDIVVYCSTPLQAGVWYNVVATYATAQASKPWFSGSARIYLNGTLCGINSALGVNSFIPAANPGSKPNICIGGRPAFGDPGLCNIANFRGSIAEVAVWKDELKISWIRSLATGVPPWKIRRASTDHAGQLIGYWPLWGSKNNEPDLSGFGFSQNGVVTGTTVADHCPCLPTQP